ncbi:MAG: cytochrome c1 [Gammaproteobacteria bacterium]|nr:cytochrome c1 [Gammaproteobacteria bacterium]
MLRIIMRCMLIGLWPVMALAAGGGVPLQHMEVDLGDKASLQRGATTFVNYCMGCHSAAYMRYNRIGRDLGISEQVLKTNFIFNPDDKVGDTMTIAMRKTDAELVYFGVNPPDLSVIARSRGADWLYTYFLSFYKDDSRPFGVNNLVFKDVGMPHVLWELQGLQSPVYETVTTADGTEKKIITELEPLTEGLQSPEEYDQTVRDLVNFMVYLGEPAQLQRKKVGFWVLLYLVIILLPLTYLLKKEYWRDIH